ncbi:MAG: PPC domain-containing protein [Acidobacteriaceae bacterium]
MKNLKVSLFAIVCGLIVLCSQAWAQTAISPGPTTTGTISSADSSNSYIFTGSAGDVIDLTMTTTSGGLVPKIQLYSSSGTLLATAVNAFCNPGPVEMNTFMLQSAGSYTVIVSDCSNTNTGSYDLYFQSTSSPSEATSLAFGETVSDAIGLAAQSNTYTFSANAGAVIDFTMTTTSGSLAPKIRLYNPNGELNMSASNSFCDPGPVEMNTVTLPSTGTYTVLVGDCGDTNTGNYDLYSQLTDDAPYPLPLVFGQTQPGTVTTAAQSNTYTFNANAGDVLDMTMTATSPSLAPKIRLYNPNGELNTSASNSFCDPGLVEMNTVTLPSTGTYTVLIGDCSDTNTGNYELYSQRTNNPSGASQLSIGQTASGLIGSAAESNTYTFSANAGDVLDMTMTTASGSLAPKIRLYNPNGELNTSASNSFCDPGPVEMNTVTLPSTGTYTVLIGDCSDTNTGNYEIYLQRTSNPAGVAYFVFGGVAQTGTISTAAQSNTYIFGGSIDNVVDFTMTTTSGSLTPKLRLYNPDGSLAASASNSFCDPGPVEMNSVTLTQTGSFTLLVGDCSDTNSGNYSISGQCFGSCPITTPIDPWIQVNGGTWQEVASVSVNSGDTVNLGPHPVSGGTWSWTGPSGFTSTARVLYGVRLAAGTNVYTATYTNTAGGQSTQAFTVTVRTPIVPYIQVNGGSWTQESTATVSLGATVNLGPQPVSGGSWSWTGPNGFTSTSRVLDSVPLAAGANTYTATYTNTAGVQSNPQVFTITVTTPIVPYIQVSGGAWTQESTATVNVGATVNLGPQPVSGGSWSWAGPNGFTSTSRVLYGIPLAGGTNTYTATYTNAAGGQSTQAFTITVSTPIDPWIQVNGGAWQEVSSVTVAPGATVNLGPHPVSGGTWSWTGPNGFTSTSRVLYSIPLPSGTNTYTATYTNTAGGQSTQAFTITVN